ncbi:hypothetical protein [Nocardioides solisilvae]|uniref:hypothetical protein n=1 Tax=Nocardioides solisilvae TaxID=1542435 RepID=UPI000D74FA13|nr:hypothetical protein [Nocardioides solisilvae]
MIVRPPSVILAARVAVALLLAAAVTTVLTWWRREDLLTSWAEGNAGARAILAEGGLAAVEETLAVPAFVPVTVTSFVVLVMLVGVLLAFFVEGFGWARLALAVIALFGVFLAVLCVASGIPTLFVVMSVVMVLLCLALLVLLFHKDTNRYFREV